MGWGRRNTFVTTPLSKSGGDIWEGRGGVPHRKVPKTVPAWGPPLCALFKKGVEDGGYPSVWGVPPWGVKNNLQLNFGVDVYYSSGNTHFRKVRKVDFSSNFEGS